VREIIYRFGKV
jgi:hypothetical protein